MIATTAHIGLQEWTALGDYGGHPRPTLFTIRIENKYHPIAAGGEDYVFNAEQGGRNVESTR
jgi:hypothetical protein